MQTLEEGFLVTESKAGLQGAAAPCLGAVPQPQLPFHFAAVGGEWSQKGGQNSNTFDRDSTMNAIPLKPESSYKHAYHDRN